MKHRLSELDEWKQAARVEAGLRREFLARAEKAEAENERLRAALRRIVEEADSDDGLTAWDGSDIAREALNLR